jgi:UDP-3-O-[3-hydroxymyristoyl] glucosamine N-acyltransferase
MSYLLSELAEKFEVMSTGDGSTRIEGVCGLSDDKRNHLAFVSQRSFLASASASQISGFISHPDFPVPNKPNLVSENPEYLIAKIATLFATSKLTGLDAIHPSATIDETSYIASNTQIGANAVIGANVSISEGTQIFPNVVIMDRCEIGANCIIYPNCTLREDTILGERVVLQAGVSIGADGFGYVMNNRKHYKIPQLGKVVIEDDVEIGANSTIDRARFNETRVGKGTKIDNLVMLAHNVKVGEDCLIVSQVGISGSTQIGDRVVLAGQVGTVGHITIADDVTVLGKGGVTKDILTAGTYAGMPIKPVKVWLRAIAKLYRSLK